MRPIEQIQAINEQLNGEGVWDGREPIPAPKPASEHLANLEFLQDWLNYKRHNLSDWLKR